MGLGKNAYRGRTCPIRTERGANRRHRKAPIRINAFGVRGPDTTVVASKEHASAEAARVGRARCKHLYALCHVLEPSARRTGLAHALWIFHRRPRRSDKGGWKRKTFQAHAWREGNGTAVIGESEVAYTTHDRGVTTWCSNALTSSVNVRRSVNRVSSLVLYIKYYKTN